MKYMRFIIGIDRLPCNIASEYYINKVDGGFQDESLPWESISIKKPAKVEATSKQESKKTLYTYQITFKTCIDITGGERYIWRLHMSGGKYMIVGNGIRPYPKCTVEVVMPDEVKDDQLNKVIVSHTTTEPLIIYRKGVF